MAPWRVHPLPDVDSDRYFLLIGLLQQIPGVTPTNRFATLAPLALVLFCVGVKEMYEDLRRHRQDDEQNSASTEVLRDGKFTTIPWRHVRVGDIARVTKGQKFPADLVLCSSSDDQAKCYVETSNLDGETNLKPKNAVPGACAEARDEAALAKLSGTIMCEAPNKNLHVFTGNLTLEGQASVSLSVDNLLLRGSSLRNTKYVHGIVLNTGMDTKMMKNSTKPPSKQSNMEKIINISLGFILGTLVVICTISTALNTLFEDKVSRNGSLSVWFLHDVVPVPSTAKSSVTFVSNPVGRWLTFLILYNNVVPISLYVSLEAVKFLVNYLVEEDQAMYAPVGNEMKGCIARTSNLIEDLGEIQYIFSDKTGTLTCNRMEFKSISCRGVMYLGRPERTVEESAKAHYCPTPGVLMNDPHFVEDMTAPNSLGDEHADFIRAYLTVLAVCHTVNIEAEIEEGKEPYMASSPDELALVKAAKAFGFKFVERNQSKVSVDIMGKVQKFEVLKVNAFNSDRKRMSVVVRLEDGSLKLLAKGADNMMLERLESDVNIEASYLEKTKEHLTFFSCEGLRVLVLAWKSVSEADYVTWSDQYDKAAMSIDNRDVLLAEAAERIEHDMVLLGVTAIEDRLQDGVPETIRKLSQA